ncbi:hypothetical protein ZIOFF_002221 [Zingiber officinale]|uniref:Uncharacterized protein n=1 Tax=Zingiber officinale TaxID=94328 RepID=A0A8J5IKU7_ZINOF|nr:hypothetical protein ZIOFF_002221 [Zingiber officinale]
MDLFEAQSKVTSGDQSEIESVKTSEEGTPNFFLKDSPVTASETGISSPFGVGTLRRVCDFLLLGYNFGELYVELSDDDTKAKSSGSIAAHHVLWRIRQCAQAIMLIAAATAVASRASANKTASVADATKTPAVVGSDAAPKAAQSSAAPVLTRTLSFLSSSASAEGALVKQPQLASNSSSSLGKLQAGHLLLPWLLINFFKIIVFHTSPELPIARRHSLQRFLEKRRNRVVSNAPYASSKPLNTTEMASEAQTQLI